MNVYHNCTKARVTRCAHSYSTLTSIICERINIEVFVNICSSALKNIAGYVHSQQNGPLYFIQSQFKESVNINNTSTTVPLYAKGLNY